MPNGDASDPARPFYEGSGGGEIRTHEAFRPSGFQDRRDQPLCHPSGAVAGGVDAGPRSATAATTCHRSDLEQAD
jgi:hypothetical protein